jgi:electron transport complex protein RnfE
LKTAVVTFSEGVLIRNPAWVQMLGLCPLLAVSNSVVSSLGLAAASAFVLVASGLLVSILRRQLPDFARLPAIMLIIAGSTTLTVMLLEAYTFDLYSRIALFVQIIVTNCVILGRAEAFASKQPVHLAVLDAAGTAAGFTIALITLGAVREIIGSGTLFARMDTLFGPTAAGWTITVLPADLNLLIAVLPPGAFIIAGLLLALARVLSARRDVPDDPSAPVDAPHAR